MSLWGRLFAAGYDRALAATERAGLASQRRELLSSARGRVIELGAGTGANLPCYGDDIDLVLVEPADPMLRRLARHAALVRPRAEIVRGYGESIPAGNGSFDVAVCTLVLCTVGDLAATLAELRRVLVPDGRMLFIEHVRAEEPRLARWQDRLDPLRSRLACGCHCNRRTLAAIRAAGFDVPRVDCGRMPRAPVLTAPTIWGEAISPPV